MEKPSDFSKVDLSGFIESPKLHSSSSSLMKAEEMASSESSGASWISGFLANKTPAAHDIIAKGREGLKPWREFLKTDKFRLPASVPDFGKRVFKNVDYFKSNYLCVFVVLMLYCILTSPLLLVALAVCFGALYIVRIKNADRPVSIAGREISPGLQYCAVAALSFPIFWMAGAGSAVFWVIGASVFFIFLHAVSYASEPIPGAEFEMETV